MHYYQQHAGAEKGAEKGVKPAEKGGTKGEFAPNTPYFTFSPPFPPLFLSLSLSSLSLSLSIKTGIAEKIWLKGGAYPHPHDT